MKVEEVAPEARALDRAAAERAEKTQNRGDHIS